MNFNGDNYLRILQELCIPVHSAVTYKQQVIFQQDVALTHYLREVHVFLHEQFPDR